MALVDPVRAVRYQGEDIGQNLGLVTDIIRQVGIEISEGPLGAVADIGVTLTAEGATFTLNPRAGSDFTMTARFRVPKSPEGEARLQEITEAIEQGRGLDLNDADIEFFANGVPIAFPGPWRATSRPAPTPQSAVLEFQARGLRAERFLLSLDVRADESGGLVGETPPESASPLRVRFVAAPGRNVNLTFETDDSRATLRQQVKLARLARHLARGCRVTVWFIELDASASTRFAASGDVRSSDYWARALRLFDEIQLRVGADIRRVEALTQLDVAYLETAKRLLSTGRARMPGKGGRITTRTAGDLRDAIPAAAARKGSVPLVDTRPDMVLPLSAHPFGIGPVTLRYVALWPPDVSVERGEFVSVIRLDPGHVVKLERPVHE